MGVHLLNECFQVTCRGGNEVHYMSKSSPPRGFPCRRHVCGCVSVCCTPHKCHNSHKCRNSPLMSQRFPQMSQFPTNVTALPTNVTPTNVTPKTEFNHKCRNSEHRERVDTSSLSFFSSKTYQSSAKKKSFPETPWKSSKTIQKSPKVSTTLQNSLKLFRSPRKISKNLQKSPKFSKTLRNSLKLLKTIQE